MDDVTVDLGTHSLFDAKALRTAVAYMLDSGYLSDADVYGALVAIKAFLGYRIAKAEKTATYSEPG